jgi:CRP/FNR family transcriptional regulator, cyclic AMP receptor protein
MIGRGLAIRHSAAPPLLNHHAGCLAVSRHFRGRLCEQLARGPGRTLEAGERLYTMGQPATTLYLVRRGLLKTSLISPGGRELTLRLYPAGEIVGALCLCTGERREQATALESSEVVEITLDALLRRVRQDPQSAVDLASAVCEHLADAQEALRDLSFTPVTERLGRALLGLASRLGEPGPGGTLLSHYITQEELAHIVGARREVVSVLLNRLRTDGLINYTRRGLIRINREALQSYVDSISET